ncbi:MAG: hypothetical protein ACREBS_08235 [Nitrososphaerales archaeon]
MQRTRERISTLRREGELPYYLRKATPDLDWKLRFKIIAAKASRNNKKPGFYNFTEVSIRDELARMGFVEGKSFLHQHRIFAYRGSRGQSVYFWLDMFIPSLLLAIEADGEIWRQFFDMKKRDKRRDAILRRRYGIKVVRLNSYHLRKKRLGKILSRLVEKRATQLSSDEDSGRSQQ